MEPTSQILINDSDSYKPNTKANNNLNNSMTEADNNWKSFRQHICDTISIITFWKYKLDFAITNIVEHNSYLEDSNNNNLVNCSTKNDAELYKDYIIEPDADHFDQPDEYKANSDNLDLHHKLTVEHLQKRLESSILQKRLSIKRSFMMMGNLFSQHEMIFKPYHRLKAYTDQITNLQYSVNDEEETSLEDHDSTSISYAEVLSDLMTITNDIDDVSQRSVVFSQKYDGRELS